MGQIVVRNLDDAVLSALRLRASQRGVSLAEEIRRTLTDSVDLSRTLAAARLDAVRARIDSGGGPSIAGDLRRDRQRDAAD